jgi:hypothetical protein
MTLPTWSDDWFLFADWGDAPFALAGLALCFLLILWWRQQSGAWFRVAVGTLLAALLLAIASVFLFVVPPHFAGCPDGCDGWRGYPLRVALYRLDGGSELGAGDFALNVLILWLLWLAASVSWRILAAFFRLGTRARRTRTLFVLIFVIAPWALLPRILNPPQPPVAGEELRLANNARRAAEFTYGITGFWIHRLALEDVRRDPSVAPGDTSDGASTGAGNQVCLRGYTYFFVPWQRYRIGLDPNGATALSLVEVPLEGSCWQ